MTQIPVTRATELHTSELHTAGITNGVSSVNEKVAQYALRLADDSLILAHQLGWWISRAPELEEDVALGNIALDLLGNARVLLSYAGRAWHRSEDDLAFWRDEPEFRSAHIVEQPNGDFAHTIVRQLIMSCYQHELYADLAASTDPTLAAVAQKAVKEVEYHRDHAQQWTLRLGIGTDESHTRMVLAMTDLWPYVHELFHDDDLTSELAADGVAVQPSSLRPRFDMGVTEVLRGAGLEEPRGPIARGGGRRGIHSEYLGLLLTEMQVLARQHPGASW